MYQYITAGVLALICLGQFIEASPVNSPAVMPKTCAEKNKTFCTEKGPDYPENLIDDLLKDFNTMFEDVRKDTMPGKRLGSAKSECAAAVTFEPIHVMVDENDNVRYVVQHKEKFNQVIYIEQCLNPGPIKNETNLLTPRQIEHNAFECQQTYMHFKLLVLSLDGTKLEAVNMKNGIPVCCACVLTKPSHK